MISDSPAHVAVIMLTLLRVSVYLLILFVSSRFILFSGTAHEGKRWSEQPEIAAVCDCEFEIAGCTVQGCFAHLAQLRLSRPWKGGIKR
jgi:hypothetical protein